MKKPKTYGGRWEVQRCIDQGGQGQVFLVTDLSGQEHHLCALKRILNCKRRDRFQREVEACQRLSNPGIIRLIDCSAIIQTATADEDKMYLVMPYLGGGNLDRRAGLYKDSVDSVVHVALRIANALLHAHQNQVIHRDVKPANLLFAREDHDVILSDFGICLIRDMPRATAGDEAVGPAYFMAPELEQGGQLEVSPAADVYSLGKVIYFMLSGGVLLPRERHREERYDIFSERGMRHELIGQLLDRMIAPQDRRISGMDQVAEELERIRQWDRREGILLSPKAQSALRRLATSKRDATTLEHITKAQDEEKQARIARFLNGLTDWLDDKLPVLAAALSSGGSLNATVLNAQEATTLIGEVVTFQTHPLFVVTPRLLRGVRIVGERGRTARAANLLFGAYTTIKDRAHNTNPEEPRIMETDDVWFIPNYYEDRHTQGAFTKIEQRPESGEQVTRRYRGEECSVGLRSTLQSWPSDAAQYEHILTQGVEAFLDAFDKRLGSATFTVWGDR